MAEQDIELKIALETKEAIERLEKLTSAALDQQKKIQSGFSLLKFDALLNIANVAIDAIKGIAGALKAPIAEATEADRVFDQLNINLKLAGDFSQEASKSFVELAEGIQKTSSFSDDAVLSAASLAKALGASNEQALKLVKAATDLSAVTGRDLESSTRILSATLQGQGTQIGRLIPQLRGLTEEQLKAGVAVDFVADRFKGAADAIGNTFAGQQAKVSNIFNDLEESIGRLITQSPVVIGVIKTFGEILNELNRFVINNSDAIRLFVEKGIIFLAKAMSSSLNVISTFIKITGAIGDIVLSALSGIFNLASKLPSVLSAPFNLLIDALGLAGEGLLIFLDLISKIPGISGALDKVGLSAEVIDSGIKKATESLSKLTEGNSFKKLTSGASEFVDGINKGNQLIRNGTTSAIDALANRSDKFAKDFEGKIGTAVERASDAIANGKPIRIPLNAEQISKEFKKGFDNFSKTILETGLKVNIKTLDLSADQAQFIGAGAKIASSILKGAEGAKELFSSLAGGIANALIPGLGPVVSEIVGVLSQGPDKVREMITAFTAQIPVIIENIILSLPVLIESLTQGLIAAVDVLIQRAPEIVSALIVEIARVGPVLAAQMPTVATRLAAELIGQAPNIAVAAIDSFVKEMPRAAQTFVQELLNQIKGAVGGIFGGGKGGGGLGGILGGVLGGPAGGLIGGSIGKVFKFADGGTVPGGAPFNDRVPSLLTPGEQVISRDLTSKIEGFIDSNSGSQTQSVVVNLQVNEETAANFILNLRRKGFNLG